MGRGNNYSMRENDDTVFIPGNCKMDEVKASKSKGHLFEEKVPTTLREHDIQYANGF